tara:strand:+ start:509 stop:955 length:447 start_codon:yes stop_codon:yes gene_type:complete
MKIKLVFFSLLLLTIGCKSDDDSIKNEEIKIALNPPEWIKGVWIDETLTENGDFGWKFTDDDAIWIIGGSESFSLKSRAQYEIDISSQANNQNDVLRETFGENFYKITEISYDGGYLESDYYFEKENNSIIIWKSGPGFEDYVLTKRQ